MIRRERFGRSAGTGKGCGRPQASREATSLVSCSECIPLAEEVVDMSAVIGTDGQARAWLECVLQKALVAKCAEMLGAGQKLLEMTTEYAKVRVQFGKPIGVLQAIQHHCANLATCIETTELMTYRAAWLIDQHGSAPRSAFQAKAWASDACKRAAALGHQVHGGMGFSQEYDLFLYSSRMTAFARYMGGRDWSYERLAQELGLGKPN